MTDQQRCEATSGKGERCDMEAGHTGAHHAFLAHATIAWGWTR